MMVVHNSVIRAVLGGLVLLVSLATAPAQAGEAGKTGNTGDDDMAPMGRVQIAGDALQRIAESRLLEACFPIYLLRGGGVINNPVPGAVAACLPTVNHFTGVPGCYVACYANDNPYAVYSVGGAIGVVGQIRVPGRYEGRIARPEGYETADISAEPSFKQLCAEAFPEACGKGQCWAGGDTGGWFGIP